MNLPSKWNNRTELISEWCSKYRGISPIMFESVYDYVTEGQRFGGFLTALFSNDLVEAFGRADDFNAASMHDWAKLLYNDVPRECWGSYEKIQAWRKAHNDD